QAQEPAGFVEQITKGVKAPRAGDQVEEIAVLAGCIVDPSPCGASATIAELHAQAAARRVVDIADAPRAPLATAVREIVAGHVFGPSAKTAREIGGGLAHGGLQEEEGPAAWRAQLRRETAIRRLRRARACRVSPLRALWRTPAADVLRAPASPLSRRARTSAPMCAEARGPSRCRRAGPRRPGPSRPSSGGRGARPGPRPSPRAPHRGCAPC